MEKKEHDNGSRNSFLKFSQYKRLRITVHKTKTIAIEMRGIATQFIHPATNVLIVASINELKPHNPSAKPLAASGKCS